MHREMLGEMHGLMGDFAYGIAQISELVLNLKNFSRMDAAATDAVNLNECIESALNIGRKCSRTKWSHQGAGRSAHDHLRPVAAQSGVSQPLHHAAQAMESQGQLRIKTGMR